MGTHPTANEAVRLLPMEAGPICCAVVAAQGAVYLVRLGLIVKRGL